MTPDPLDPSELGNIAHMLLDIRDRLVLSSDDARVIEDAVGYLRAQADAQPVAWRDHVEQRIRGWRQRTMNRSGDRLALDDMMGQDSIDDLIDYVCDEWSDPAPAVPQAEPIDPHMIVADDRFPDAQAEPKRKPLSDERIDAALQTDPVLITRLMIGSMTVGEFKAALRRVARTIERAHGIGGSDE